MALGLAFSGSLLPPKRLPEKHTAPPSAFCRAADSATISAV
ncbi:hypothetical protein [Eikenella longinqua]|nr:hypothetical protein [Eikenella longinqua]